MQTSDVLTLFLFSHVLTQQNLGQSDTLERFKIFQLTNNPLLKLLKNSTSIVNVIRIYQPHQQARLNQLTDTEICIQHVDTNIRLCKTCRLNNM